jgi:hypothetical protein
MLSSEWRKTDVTGTGDNADMSYSDWAFGFSISGAVVTVTAGEIHHGSRTVIDVAQTNITITADYQYVWVEYTFGAAAGGYPPAAVIPAPQPSRPVSDETTFRCWLHQFRAINGVVSLYRIGHLGNIELPGSFG